jgi:flagellar assembly protein FliH
MATDAPAGKSKVITGEGVETAYQRWELPNLLTADQMQRLQQQAREEGFAQGRAEALKAVLAEMQPRVDKLDGVLNTLAEPLRELDDRIEQELVTLAMAAARLIVRRELKTDPGIVIAAVREAMGALPAASRAIRLHLHPEDAALVREVMGVAEDERAWRIVDDPTQSRGGCKLLTETSVVDASVDNRLLAVMASILGGERSND